MLRLGHLSFRGKCPKHPAYNPAASHVELDTTCRLCQALAEIHAAHQHLLHLVRVFPTRHREYLPARSSKENEDAGHSQMALFAHDLDPN